MSLKKSKLKLKRINQMIELVQRDEERQAKIVGRLQGHFQQEYGKLQALESYHRDYTNSNTQNQLQHTQINLYQNYQHFIGKINNTIASQKFRVSDIENRLLKQRKILADINVKVKSYQGYHAAQEKTHMQKLDAREQFIAEELYSMKQFNKDGE